MISFLQGAVRRLKSLVSPEPPFYLAERFPQYCIGKGTYGHPKVVSWEEKAKLVIGNYTSIARDVQIFLGGNHHTDWVTTYPFDVLWQKVGHPCTKGDVVIGSDVWIGRDALILSGVTIGHGAVIGARAVVAKDVPPYAIVVGNPGTIVKFRFDENIRTRLLQSAWWDLDEAQIKILLPLLIDTDIQKFLDHLEKVHANSGSLSDI
ncbi:CatB-related O-acetyltransferase [Hydrogenophaga sp.]|uniref:CatB-related O-acetyltransferase n=1 Tax=Hydrogenophaga sp. TaxID=1904254 RepID=UPI002733075F|nr:CatB-related O-acetyltransferase [Hydrogenophaga sp.]MDP3884872.1 CatB-related O-acetyltransferase [Hydrogenophaga sp.]